MKYEKIHIKTPDDIVALLKYWAKRREENFLAITLDGYHDVIRVHHITKGIVNKTIVHPRECFYLAIKDNAVAIVFVHNHPSGYVEPSQEDNGIIQNLNMAGVILGINVVDNLIIAKNGKYYSYFQNGKMNKWYNEIEMNNYVNMIAAENNKECL
jgi:DNA repair protein RadC